MHDSIGHHGNTAYEHGDGQDTDEYQRTHQDANQSGHNPQCASADAQQCGYGYDDKDDPQDYLKGTAGPGTGAAVASLCAVGIILPAAVAVLCAVGIILPAAAL